MAKNKSVKAPWQHNEPVKMLVCHMSEGELEGLDALQGGRVEDPETGLPEYTRLAEIIENPEIQDIFMQVEGDIKDDGKMSPQLDQAYSTAKGSMPSFKDNDDDESPEVKEIQDKTGRAPDKKMALLPENLVRFLVKINPHVSVNPKTQLLEFGFNPFKKGKGGGNPLTEVIRIAGTLGGAYLGGGWGAGIGNAVASAATGKNMGDSLMSGIKNGALMYGLQSLAGAIPGVGNMVGKMPYVGGMMSGILGGGAAAPAAGAAMVPAQQAQAAAPAKAPAASNAGFLGGLFGGGNNAQSPMGGMGPVLLMHALAAQADKQHHQDQMKAYEEHKREVAKGRQRQGLSQEWSEPQSTRMVRNPAYNRNATEPLYIEEPAPYKEGGLVQSYTEGTIVRGAGDGQADKIRTSVPEDSYIIDATSVADFGNGSSSSGAEVLKKFENHIKQRYGHLAPHIQYSKGQVPVYLANEEYKFDPLTVSLLGEGSNKVGAARLKTMVKNLRRHKNSNGLGLPPKAKDPMQYIGGK